MSKPEKYSVCKINKVRKICLVVCFLMLAGCGASTPLKQYHYTDDLPIYPSVAEALSVRNSSIESLNVYTNSFRSEFIYAKDFLVPIRFKLETNIDEGQVVTTVVDVESESTEKNIFGDYEWSGGYGPGFLSFDINGYVNAYNEEILSGMSSRYEQLKANYLNDIEFNLKVVSGLTDIAAEQWHEHNMRDRVYPFTLPLGNFKNNKNANIDKKYHVTFRYTAWGENQFIVDLYTDDKRMARYKKGDQVSFKAKSVVLMRGFSFFMENGLALEEVLNEYQK